MKFNIRYSRTIAAILFALVCTRAASHSSSIAADPFAASCGAPNFALPSPLLPTRGLSLFVAGDFNKDGRADVVTISFTDQNILSFAAGNAAGAFDSMVSRPLGISPIYRFVLNAADVNRDGNLDLALLDGGAQKLYILTGNGAGGFANPVSYKASPQGDTMMLADFNGDGAMDVVAGSDFTAQLTILLGAGAGGFQPETLFSLAGTFDAAIRLGAGDFNGDGKLDLIYLGRQSFQFYFLPGDGAGKFGQAVPISFVDRSVQGVVRPASLRIGDVTGDGKADVVVTSDKGLSVVTGNGAGGFAEAVMYLRESGAGDVFIGDFNGDGRNDIAAGAGVDLTLLRGLGNGMFAEPAQFVTGARNEASKRGVVLDVNRDGLTDLLLTASVGFLQEYVGGFVLVPGHRETGLALPRALPINAGANATALDDLNGDGTPDLVVAYGLEPNAGGIAVYPGDGAGGFGSPATYPAMRPVLVAIRDFTRDGKPDLAVLNEDGNNLTILINDGSGKFPTSRPTATPARTLQLGIGDFTSDGKLDLIVPGNNLDLVLLAGGDNATFTPLTTGIATGLYPDLFAIGNYDGDNNLDLAVLATNTTFMCQQASEVAILSGNGRGGFAESRRVRFPDAVNTLASGDLNGDGRADLITSNRCDLSSGGIAIAMSAAGGGFASPVRYPVRDAARFLTADLNGDARPELIATERFGGVVVLTNAGNGTLIAPVRLDVGANEHLSVGDANKDGANDLLVVKSTNANRAIVLVPNATQCALVDDATAVSAASYLGDPLAGEFIGALFGANLVTETKAATTLPLPTTLAGASVKVRDNVGVERLAPLFFVSPGQINFQIPPDTSTGAVLLTVVKPGGRFATDTADIQPTAPGLFSADATGKGYPAAVVLRIKSNGAQSYEPVVRFDAAQNKLVAVPIDLSVASDQVFLLLFGTGLRNNSGLGAVMARVGGITAEVGYAGAQGGFIGLDQVNMRLPNSLAGRGDVQIALTADGRAANLVLVNVK